MTTYRALLSCIDNQLFQKRSIVLAIDDDEDNLTLISYALEPLHCEFIGETSGYAALEIVQARQPDLILMDIMLPDIHGIEFMRRLKQNVQTQRIPVIAITGLASPEDRAELLHEGFSDYLSKPYMVDELEAMVRSHLHQVAE
jgi:CheY-like chemotaxis protein